MKPSFKYNNNEVKDSCDQYRNIKGKHYINWTYRTELFDTIKQLAKTKKISTRTIQGELYVEKGNDMTIIELSEILEIK